MRYDLVFRFFKIFVVVLLAVLPLRIFAQWSTDPYNNLIVGYGLLPELCSDSTGGCYITYEQGTTYPRHLILERLNRYGYKPWGTGKRILGEYSEQSGAKIVEDGQNGVIIAYLDEEETGMYNWITRLRVQRIDSSGNFLWGPNGIRVSLSETNQYDEEIASDGNNGCFVAWYDTTNILRLQKINDLGQRMFGDSGIYIDASNSNDVQIVSDELEQCFLYVNDASGARLHKINSIGNKLWGINGISVEAGWASPKFISDGKGGVIYGGMRGISYNDGDPYYSARCQKVDSSGYILWGDNGIILDDSIQNIVLNAPSIQLTNNYDEGATFAWNAITLNGKLRTFTQRVRPNGNFVFQDSVKRVSIADSMGNGPWAIITSLDDSKIYVNADGRNNGSIFGQRMDSLGAMLWNDGDIALSLLELGYVKVATDMLGGLIFAGFDQSDFSIRVQQCSRNGLLGEIITSIEEIHNENTCYDFLLNQNYPNPFNPLTIINYQLPKDNYVTIKVYNILGEDVATLVDGFETAGYKSVDFDASSLSSGVYFYRMQAGSYNAVMKFVVMK